MKTSYTVGVREVHVRFYRVDANDAEEAKLLVQQRSAEVTDLEHQEYSHELNSDTWSVEKNVGM